MNVLVLNGEEVERLLDLDLLVESLTGAFTELSAGRVSVPPRIAARSGNGFVAAMPGHLPGAGLEVKLVSVFPDNGERDLPTHQAVIVVFDESTGSPLCILDGTYITAARTAAASALSARLLARRDCRRLAIIGAGVQGHSHLVALTRVREFEEVRIASRSPERAARLASEHPRALAVGSIEDAVRGSDVVCCCTDSAQPVLSFSWLDSGTHVTSVGASARGPELDTTTVTAGRLFVESRVAFEPYPAGAHELQGLDPVRATELGEVLAGTRPGRVSEAEVTVYKSIGHAVEDAAAAHLVYEHARREGVGRAVAL